MAAISRCEEGEEKEVTLRLTIAERHGIVRCTSGAPGPLGLEKILRETGAFSIRRIKEQA